MTLHSAIRAVVSSEGDSASIRELNDETRRIYRAQRDNGNARDIDDIRRDVLAQTNRMYSREGDDTLLAICAGSQNFYPAEDGLTMHDGNEISQTYYENECFTCMNCSEIYDTSDECINRDNGEHFCDGCANSEWYYATNGNWYSDHETSPDCDDDECDDDTGDSNGSGYVVTNHYKNIFDVHGKQFRKTDREHAPLFMGVELEVVPRRSRGDALAKVGPALADFCIFKEDGSLHSGGFEIVTLPSSLKYHRNAWRQFFNGPNRSVRSFDTECCGLHVHVSRDYMTSLEVGKFMFFYNTEANASFLTEIAGRTLNAHSQWCKQKPDKKIKDGIKRIDDDRYQATNMSSATRGETVEVRIYKGNVSEFGFFRCLEFTAASVEFAKATNATKEGLTAAAFIAWFNKPNVRAEYPALWHWLIRKGHITTPHKRKADAPVLDFDETAAA